MRINNRRFKQVWTIWDHIAFEGEYYFGKIVQRPYWNIKHFILNCFKYLPILWSDRDWDYSYLYRLMHYKLSWMYTCMEEGHCVFRENKKRKMKIAIESLKRLLEDDYTLSDDHPLKKVERSLEREQEEDESFIDWLNSRIDHLCVIDKKKYYKLSKKIHALEDARQDEDLKRVCDMMYKQSRGWWD